MTFSSLAALEVVILTTSSAANDENFVKMTTFSFQCVGLAVTVVHIYTQDVFAGNRSNSSTLHDKFFFVW